MSEKWFPTDTLMYILVTQCFYPSHSCFIIMHCICIISVFSFILMHSQINFANAINQCIMLTVHQCFPTDYSCITIMIYYVSKKYMQNFLNSKWWIFQDLLTSGGDRVRLHPCNGSLFLFL